MRIIPFIIGLLVTLTLIIVLDRRWGSIPALGRFLSPQQGFWQNAEDVDGGIDETIPVKGLKGKAEVYFDDRMVPHIFADHDEDAYFIQGYLHARYRLWQMEIQTFLAAGRLSEKFGNDPRYINLDRENRRNGMGFAAENALKNFEADPQMKATCDAYTAGVNAYINSLSASAMPLEYKLLGYRPEPWTNLKIALFLKQMSKTLADYGPDLSYSVTKEAFSFDELMQLDPQVPDSLVPIIPKGTVFSTPGVVPIAPANADSLYFEKKDTVSVEEFSKQDPNNGSNNWVVSGKKTKSGSPILCNDPHLELSFPSIWYEMQITTPNMNVYGATFPGSPSVIIGFNDHIAWGVTNSQRDVKDYFEIKFRDDSRQEYLFNEKWEKTSFRIEDIHIKGADLFKDTVAYTVFGPVLYDKSFSKIIANGKAIAVRWAAHDPSNEGRTFYELNRAKGYDDYLAAIRHFSCPGQNFVFGSKQGDIALWQQGRFPARWYGQGMYLMPGIDSSYMWQGYIPQEENPHAHTDSGFLQSANQRPADSTYPYFIPGSYINARGVSISRHLENMNNITPQDMMALQNNNYHLFAEGARSMLFKYLQQGQLDEDEKKYADMVAAWDLVADPDATGPTVFQCWFDSLEALVWNDEWQQKKMSNWSEGKKADSLTIGYPDEQTLLEWINRDSAFSYIDNKNTSDTESIAGLVTTALKRATVTLKKAEAENRLQWTRFKDPTIYHLLKDALMPFARKIPVGGWSNVINATTHSHGPSWRMIVHLTATTEAYGVYPGGQSGNPGSMYYDNFVDTWANGKYYPLWVMKQNEATDKRIIGKIIFSNS